MGYAKEFCAPPWSASNQNRVGVRRTEVDGADAVTRGAARRIKTGPLPKLPEHALGGLKTLETRALPGLFLGAFVALVVIQVLLRI